MTGGATPTHMEGLKPDRLFGILHVIEATLQTEEGDAASRERTSQFKVAVEEELKRQGIEVVTPS